MARLVLQFKITLRDIEPAIWRRIQVPREYSFWDLHVAIQDAMGWLDYHLHAFHPATSSEETEIGIPDDDLGADVLPGWEVPLVDYFREPGTSMEYAYDFGDDWSHEVLLEAILPRDRDEKYPVCVAGERACPPEDVGGPPGYAQLLEVLANPGSPDHADMVSWLQNHARNYHPYDPEAFSPAAVEFWNPRKRWQIAFGDERG